MSRFTPRQGVALGGPGPLEDAIAGEARIERVEATGLTVAGSPEVELDLLVALPDREPYRVCRRLVVSRLVRHNLEAGRDVPVRVDRSDPLRLAIG